MPIDSTRLEELQIVRKVRETVRRWWGIELSFTDAKGYVLDHGKGIIIPPQNRICTACLGDKEGLRRCKREHREGGGAPRRRRRHATCHHLWSCMEAGGLNVGERTLL